MFNLLTPAFDLFESSAKWATIGVIAALIIAGAIIFFVKKDIFTKYLKYAIFGLLVYFLVVGILGLVLDMKEGFADGDFTADTVWFVTIPVICLLSILLISIISVAIVSKKANPQTAKATIKKTTLIFGIIDLTALIVVGVLLAIYFEKVKDWYTTLNQPILYVCAALVIIVIVALAFLLNTDDKPIDTRCIAFAGVSIAMSFGLSYIKLFEMPQGGSVTLFSLLPIMIFSYAYGTKKGVFVCFIYGVLQAIQDPWIIHPAQFLLDYPVAFAAIGLSGAFANVKAFAKLPQVAFAVGGITASALRFASHVLSGVFAFASTYAGDLNSWLYSLGYNSFVFIDMAIVLAIGVIVFSSKSFMHEVNKMINR